MIINSKIIGVGHYLPTKIYTNKDLEEIVETTDEWITERTGIKERHIVAENEFTSDLSCKASLMAIEDAKIQNEDIDAIIVATITPDRFFPSTAVILQEKLNIKKCFSFDIQAACSGFVYAMTMANSLIKTKQAKNVLVVGAESISRVIDWKDRNTCVLFGDGAGAIILSSTEEENKGVLISNLYSDGNYVDILKSNGGLCVGVKNIFLHMDGKEVFKIAVSKMYDSVIKTLQDINLTTKDISLLIPHQANKRIIDAVSEKLQLEREKCICTVDKHGNTSAASIPLALSCAKQEGKIKDNDIIVFEALGAGLTWGCLVFRW